MPYMTIYPFRLPRSTNAATLVFAVEEGAEQARAANRVNLTALRAAALATLRGLVPLTTAFPIRDRSAVPGPKSHTHACGKASPPLRSFSAPQPTRGIRVRPKNNSAGPRLASGSSRCAARR